MRRRARQRRVRYLFLPHGQFVLGVVVLAAQVRRLLFEPADLGAVGVLALVAHQVGQVGAQLLVV